MEKKKLIYSLIVILYFSLTGFILADTFVVNNTGDDGPGSLRQAMEDVDSHVGADTIVFHIPEGVEGHDAEAGVWEIAVESPLPILYDDSTFINGYSQAEYIGGDPNNKGPEIVINGIGAGKYTGIRLSSSYNIVAHLVINRFSSSQINMYAGHNRVIGCYLGTDYTGEKRYPDQDYGIFLGGGSEYNIIGGLAENEGNLISGHIHEGIQLRNSHHNEIRGNIIGLNRTGEDTLTNGFHGVEILSSSRGNIIGPGNVISGNNSYGIYISGAGCDSTTIIGNYIGTDISGTGRIGFQRYGISIHDKSQHNIIGGSIPEERNVICGNKYQGIEIYGDSTDNNIIQGNYIGINATGTDTLGNGRGILLLSGTQHNQIGPGNVISGNYGRGIDIQDEGTDSNTVIGNLIGLDPGGTLAWGNQSSGISLTSGSSHNTIGGDQSEMRNIISGNEQTGIYLYVAGTDSNRIMGNYLGTDITGIFALPNHQYGIGIFSGVTGTLIGGEEEGEGNLISGNENSGIYIYGEGADENIIAGNWIGTDVTGEQPLKNGNDGVSIYSGSKNNQIGPKNVIAYNEWNGVAVSGEGSTGNTITQNSIYSNRYRGINSINGGNSELEPPEITSISSVSGTAVPNALVEIFSGPDDEGKLFEDSVRADGSGSFYWPESPEGPWVTATATDVAGNTSEFSQPVLLGNIVVTTTADTGVGSLRWAIEMANQSSGQDSINFNISTDDDGFDGTVWTIRPQSELPEINDGVVIDGTTQAINQEDTNEQGPEIVLNGRDLEEYTSGLRILSADNVITGLVIGGFRSSGIYLGGSSTRNNIISGNYIGTTATGDDTLGNLYGIFMTENVTHTLIGGYEPGSRNIISGNHNDGIVIRGDSNTVVNNYIGVDVSGSSRLPNEDDGIYMYTDAQDNQIGGGGVSGRNVISGNNGDGIYLDDGTGNRIQGNYIGLNAAGNDSLSNHYGIYISCNHNLVGGSRDTEGNIIFGNEGYGIYLSNADSNEVYGNIIGTNADMDTVGGNGYSGISLYNAQGNIMGGENSQQGNIIVNNNSEGIILSGLETENNIISRNYIGIDPEGRSLPNGWEGVRIRDGASYNTIGPANVIAYNLLEGIAVQDSASIGNTITRNSIYGNKGKGIILLYEANQNIQKPVIQVGANVSGTAPPLSTVEIFSGPDEEGKDFEGSTTANEAGTFIWEGTPASSWVTATATDMAGNTSEFSLAWLSQDLVVTTTADTGEGSLRWAINQSNFTGQQDTIWFNISEDDDNFDETVWRIAPQTELPELTGGGTVIYGLSQKDNKGDTNPEGPEIFLDGSEIMESSNGLRISSSHNAICGMVISGFPAGGLILEGEEVKHNHVYANFIGTTPAGDDTLKNDAGIYILWGAGRNRIGGMGPDSMNVISGNRKNGIDIIDADSNVVIGNIIGLTASGDETLANERSGIEISYRSSYNRIGGSSVRERNIISGNHYYGVNILDEETSYNKVMGNFIGLGRDGLTDFGNGYQGIAIRSGAQYNTVGGDTYYERNCISGNERDGIRIYSENTIHNHVLGNYIGVDSSGSVAVGNGYSGIYLYNETSHNIIGKGNIISGNNSRGILISGAYTDSNTVQGNWIGLDYTGQDTIPNKSSGMEILDFASYNLIGGPDYTDRNIVSGNGYIGIRIFQDSVAYNIIQNNFLGTDTSGTLALGNSGAGIYVSGMKNVIKDNTVSANSQGIYVYNSRGGNSMLNNSVGVGADGITPLPNNSYGFLVAGRAISDTIGPGNKIWYNQSWGIYMNGSDSQKVTITQNSISGNIQGGISLGNNANAGIAAPVITGENPLTGTAPPDCRIEVFSDTSDQGGIYEGYTTADESGNWTFTGDLSGPRVTATATDTEGNTSPFSISMETSVKPIENAQIPERFFLTQNYPNPFNPVTTIRFGVRKACQVVLKIYNIRGREITTIIDKYYSAGEYEVRVDASRFSSGIYIYKIQMADFVAIKKMVLLE